MEKQHVLYSGKTKTIYATDDADYFVMLFRDDTTAFNNAKHAQLARKGMVNNYFNAFIMEKLSQAGIKNHFKQRLTDNTSLVHNLAMLPVESVVRNFAAGTLSKRYGIEEGREFDPAIFEFFYKSDELNDPMINSSHIVTFNWATKADIAEMQRLSLQVNDVLRPLFEEAGFYLVDFKLEFGRYQGELLLGDEFTPDSCRIWDKASMDKYDKDRFRRDLGSVIDFYMQAAQRLGISIPNV